MMSLSLLPPRGPPRRSPSADGAPGSSPRATPAFIDALIAGDEAAYADLVRDHGPRMLAVATRYLPRVADAEDALQDAFLNVVRAIGGFQRASSLETWLHRVVVNSALMTLRRRRRKPESPLDETTLGADARPPRRHGPEPSAHDVLATREVRGLVRVAVAQLPETQRSILLLRDVEALELRAIAELLDVGLSTVKSRLHRARRALAHELDPHWLEPDA